MWLQEILKLHMLTPWYFSCPVLVSSQAEVVQTPFHPLPALSSPVKMSLTLHRIALKIKWGTSIILIQYLTRAYVLLLRFPGHMAPEGGAGEAGGYSQHPKAQVEIGCQNQIITSSWGKRTYKTLRLWASFSLVRNPAFVSEKLAGTKGPYLLRLLSGATCSYPTEARVPKWWGLWR